eukprot:TRINITY_DN38664_c0_g1_i1.p1 TRINITY_DN38664_c0_g1~~TRINITY_DN38664_c0_g1_i1.p1  ORF type:complete len:341 (-),score=24.31 TRINITY_DN38664_c0_g1_i1:1342-2322(-)
MVYFLFDHLAWMARAGIIAGHLSGRFCHVSAFGESVSYVAFIWLELWRIRLGALEERRLKARLRTLQKSELLPKKVKDFQVQGEEDEGEDNEPCEDPKCTTCSPRALSNSDSRENPPSQADRSSQEGELRRSFSASEDAPGVARGVSPPRSDSASFPSSIGPSSPGMTALPTKSVQLSTASKNDSSDPSDMRQRGAAAPLSGMPDRADGLSLSNPPSDPLVASERGVDLAPSFSTLNSGPSKQSSQEEEEQRRHLHLVQTVHELQTAMSQIRQQRVMQSCAIAANVADLIIAIAEVEPNPFCQHPLVFGLSGLVSAWSGWYRNWPA